MGCLDTVPEPALPPARPTWPWHLQATSCARTPHSCLKDWLPWGHPQLSPRCLRDAQTPSLPGHGPSEAGEPVGPRSGHPQHRAPGSTLTPTSPGDPELSWPHPIAGHKGTRSCPQLCLLPCLCFPTAGEGGLLGVRGISALLGLGTGPPQLWLPSRCLPPSGLGDPCREWGGSWAPRPPRGFLCQLSFSHFFSGHPNKGGFSYGAVTGGL